MQSWRGDFGLEKAVSMEGHSILAAPLVRGQVAMAGSHPSPEYCETPGYPASDAHDERSTRKAIFKGENTSRSCKLRSLVSILSSSFLEGLLSPAVSLRR